MLLVGKNYSTPVIRKGKKISSAPKGSTKILEEAKQTWYVEYYFRNPSNNKEERIRVTNGLNRIKDPVEKQNGFEALRVNYKELLENGYSPFSDNVELRNRLVSLTLNDARDQYIIYHKDKGSRPRTIVSFKSKTSFLIEYFGGDKLIKDITTADVTKLMLHYEKQNKWTGKTFRNSRLALINFFNYHKTIGNLDKSPFDGFVEKRKIIKSDKHKIFKQMHFEKIKDWLEKNDPYTLYILKLIYYTCARPNELRLLQIKNIDLKQSKITFPAAISKNKRTESIPLDNELAAILTDLKIQDYPNDSFVSGSIITMIGNKMQPEKKAYNGLKKCLEELKLEKENYTLYSAKHLSNVKRFRSGWQLEELKILNRHASLSQTETYLRELMDDVIISKQAPAF